MATSIHYSSLSDRGAIQLYIGPMFAGKTTHAVYTATRMSHHNKVLFINWHDDTRTTDGGQCGKFTSHNPSNVKLADRVDVKTTDRLDKIDISAYQVVVIDECQFYPDLLETCEKWAFTDQKHLYVYGLDGDYEQKPIGQTLQLVPLACHLEKLKGQCRPCVAESRAAGYTGSIDYCLSCCTAATSPDRHATYEVGGEDRYIPVCGFHAAQIKKARLSC